jgi:Zn-dependent protease
MSQNHVFILYEIIAFVFAICVHESAHAWTASKCGDPTARMLGRITLNPIKHVDPIGTILVPAIGILSGFGFVGWAKPTPVDPRNFRHQIRDDILTSLAGPASNFAIALVCAMVFQVIAMWVGDRPVASTSVLIPITELLRVFVFINILLLAFNLIPVPPLDGSHVVRHLLSESGKRIYDGFGMFALLLLFWKGAVLIQLFAMPFMLFFKTVFPRVL